MKYSFLQEWLGHAVSALSGGIYGGLKHIELVDKESFKIYKEKLVNNPALLKNEVAFHIAQEKKLIREYQKDIEFSKREAKKLAASSDALDREEAEWFSDTSEYEEKIERCYSRIKDIKKCLSENDIDYLIVLLFNYRSKLSSDIKNRISKKHRIRANILTYGGAIGGGVGYHYAKKGIKSLANRLLKK